MIYIGFGFLLCFIHKLRMTSLTMCFWVGALSVQLYFLWRYFWAGVLEGNFEKIVIDTDILIAGEASAAAQLIALCAIIGKVNQLQVLIMTLIGVIFYTLNETILLEKMVVLDSGGGLIIHAFGAIFGIVISIFLNKSNALKAKNLYGIRNSFNIAMIGTLFLWCFWPSFNGALTANKLELLLSYINTYFSLIGSVMGTIIFCMLFQNGKINMDMILNASLAGGVIMGSGSNLLEKNYVAFILGNLIGFLSSLMFEFMPALLAKCRIQDVAGVMYLHGIPGILGGFLAVIFCEVYNRGNVGH